MNIVNRGFLSVKPKQIFWDWANKINTEIQFSEEEGEETIYLITEEFFDEEPIIEQHFKKIFKNELIAVTEDEDTWPVERTIDVFLEWFNIHLGSMVFDLEKSNLLSEKI